MHHASMLNYLALPNFKQKDAQDKIEVHNFLTQDWKKEALYGWSEYKKTLAIITLGSQLIVSLSGIVVSMEQSNKEIVRIYLYLNV